MGGYSGSRCDTRVRAHSGEKGLVGEDGPIVEGGEQGLYGAFDGRNLVAPRLFPFDDGFELSLALHAAYAGAFPARADDGAYQRESVRVAEVLGEVVGIAFQVLAEASGVGDHDIAGEAAGRDVGEQLGDGAPAAIDGCCVHARARGDDGDRHRIAGLVGE
ncbi:hypothetical protein GCM10020001_114230 [Nonomuraea salmonea]